jgi:hypothetical protein
MILEEIIIKAKNTGSPPSSLSLHSQSPTHRKKDSSRCSPERKTPLNQYKTASIKELVVS